MRISASSGKATVERSDASVVARARQLCEIIGKHNFGNAELPGIAKRAVVELTALGHAMDADISSRKRKDATHGSDDGTN